MAIIYTEGTPVADVDSTTAVNWPVSTSGHLLLVLKDNDGKEFVIRGGAAWRRRLLWRD